MGCGHMDLKWIVLKEPRFSVRDHTRLPAVGNLLPHRFAVSLNRRLALGGAGGQFLRDHPAIGICITNSSVSTESVDGTIGHQKHHEKTRNLVVSSPVLYQSQVVQCRRPFFGTMAEAMTCRQIIDFPHCSKLGAGEVLWVYQRKSPGVLRLI